MTSIHIPYTRGIIRQFGSQIAEPELGVHWADRFVAKHHIDFISAYARSSDCSRARANKVNKYDEHFELMESRLAKYNIEAGNSYNMDEKGLCLESYTSQNVCSYGIDIIRAR